MLKAHTSVHRDKVNRAVGATVAEEVGQPWFAEGYSRRPYFDAGFAKGREVCEIRFSNAFGRVVALAIDVAFVGSQDVFR